MAEQIQITVSPCDGYPDADIMDKVVGGLTKEDVWGDYEKDTKGMIVAKTDETCPVFKDKLPYKSVTVICDVDQEDAVTYWLSFVHGGDCVQDIKKLKGNKLGIRSDYQCW